MLESNIPKLLESDLQIFIDIVNDLFPDNNYKNGKFTKEFRMKNKKTFDQVYVEGVLFLQNLNKNM